MDYDTYLERLIEQQTEGETCPHCKGTGYENSEEEYEQECYFCDGVGEVHPFRKREYIKEKKDESE